MLSKIILVSSITFKFFVNPDIDKKEILIYGELLGSLQIFDSEEVDTCGNFFLLK